MTNGQTPFDNATVSSGEIVSKRVKYVFGEDFVSFSGA